MGLSPWDALNYWVHGKFNFKADQISTIIEMVHQNNDEYAVENNLEVNEILSINFIAKKMDWFVTKSSMDFKGSNFSIDAIVKSKGNISDQSIRMTENNLSEEPSTIRLQSRLFYMPKLTMLHSYHPLPQFVSGVAVGKFAKLYLSFFLSFFLSFSSKLFLLFLFNCYL
jgi:hypothetical protein